MSSAAKVLLIRPNPTVNISRVIFPELLPWRRAWATGNVNHKSKVHIRPTLNQPLGVTAVLFGLAVLTTSYRFYLRHGAGIWWDDWLAFLATVSMALFVVGAYPLTGGQVSLQMMNSQRGIPADWCRLVQS